MKKATLLLSVLIFTSSVKSQQGWIFQNSITTNPLYSVRFATDSVGFAVGASGTAIKTTNAGINWTTLTVGINKNFNCVWPYSATNVWIVGDSGTIRYSYTGGSTWIPYTPPTTLNLFSVIFVNSLTGYIIGGNSQTLNHIFLKSSNGGSVWNQIAAGSGTLFNCIYFIDPNTGWVCGTLGTIVKTTNGGANFSPTNTGISDNIKSIFFSDANTGYACGDNGRILYTTNGGSVWQILNSTVTTSLNSVIYKPPTLSYPSTFAVGNGGVILRSTNNGTNWSSQSSNTGRKLNSVFFTNANTGWVVGDSGTVLKTTTGGMTLATFTYHKYNVNKTIPIGSDVFDTIKTGIIPTGTITDVNVYIDTILYTPVGGLELQFSHLGTSCLLVSHSGAEGSNFINTTFNDSASASITTGTPPFTGIYKPLGTLSVFNNLSAGGDWIIKILATSLSNHPELTGVIKSYGMTINYNVNIDVKQISSIVPEKYILFQNYPNPFNPKTNLKYQIRNNGNVKLEIFDLLGKRITTLVSENQRPGIYEVSFDASFLPSGVYLYKISTEDYNETRKMIMIK